MTPGIAGIAGNYRVIPGRLTGGGVIVLHPLEGDRTIVGEGGYRIGAGLAEVSGKK